MKSRYMFILLALLLLTLLPSTVAQDQVTLRIMHWTEQMSADSEWFSEVLANFEAMHPGVTVESNFVAFPQYLPTLETMIAGEELPDVFYGHVKSAEMGRAGLVIDYTEVMDEEFLGQFYEGPLRQTTFDGAIYGVPNTAQMFGFFVNPAIMEELGLEDPQTWDQLIEISAAINEAGYIPVAWGNSAGNVCPDFFLPLVTQFGGDVWGLDDLADPDLSWDSQPVVDALALLERLVQNNVFMPGINGVSEAQGRQVWNQGLAAMMYGGSWVPGIIADEAPEELVNSYYVIKNPAITEDSVHWTGNGSGESWHIKANTPNTELAIELVRYLLSEEVYSVSVTNTQNMPSMPWALEYIEDPYVQEMTSWLSTDGANHILFGQGSWDAVSDVCASILDGSTTPEEGAAQIQASVLAARER